jgi:hypothetical protein
VTKLERLGHSTKKLLDRTGKAGASFRSLGDPLCIPVGARPEALCRTASSFSARRPSPPQHQDTTSALASIAPCDIKRTTRPLPVLQISSPPAKPACGVWLGLWQNNISDGSAKGSSPPRGLASPRLDLEHQHNSGRRRQEVLDVWPSVRRSVQLYGLDITVIWAESERPDSRLSAVVRFCRRAL